jgi:hypothetical protein
LVTERQLVAALFDDVGDVVALEWTGHLGEWAGYRVAVRPRRLVVIDGDRFVISGDKDDAPWARLNRAMVAQPLIVRVRILVHLRVAEIVHVTKSVSVMLLL